MKHPVIFEMESSDPDDFLALVWLADHPDVDLQAVLVTPGGEDQLKLVDWALEQCESDAFIGHQYPMPLTDGRARVAPFHWRVYSGAAEHKVTQEVFHGQALIQHLLADPNVPTTYLTGCAPKQLGQALREHSNLKLARWVAQGFFAGDDVVAPQHRLVKFAGMTACASFNPGGDYRSSVELLASPNIARRVAISKNVCHGVIWTREIHRELLRRIGGKSARQGLQTMICGLDCYLRDKGTGKAMHDILAAAALLDERVVGLSEVSIARHKNGTWESTLAKNTNTWISVSYNHESFLDTLAR